MLKKIISFIALAAITSSAHAFYFTYQILKKGDVTVILLGDYHKDTPDRKITDTQTADLLAMLKKHDGLCLVEDVYTYEGNNESIKSLIQRFEPQETYIAPQSKFTIFYKPLVRNIHPMVKFTQLCRQHNIPVVNIECRFETSHLNDFSLYKKEIESTYKKLANFKPLAQSNDFYTYTTALYHEYINHLDDLNKFEPSHPLYTKIISQLKPWLQLYSIDKIVPITSQEKLYEKMLLFSFELIELNSLCEFYTALTTTNKKLFVICTGAVHCPKISGMLQSILQFKTIEENKAFPVIQKFSQDFKLLTMMQLQTLTLGNTLDIPTIFARATGPAQS